MDRETPAGAWVGTAKVEGGGVTIFYVSARDAAWVRGYSWWCNRFGYIYRQTTAIVDGKRRSVNVFLHREVAGLERGDEHQADHLNFDTLDCRRENIRILSKADNLARKRGGDCDGVEAIKSAKLARYYIHGRA